MPKFSDEEKIAIMTQNLKKHMDSYLTLSMYKINIDQELFILMLPNWKDTFDIPDDERLIRIKTYEDDSENLLNELSGLGSKLKLLRKRISIINQRHI